jgi:hypothetical protein
MLRRENDRLNIPRLPGFCAVLAVGSTVGRSHQHSQDADHSRKNLEPGYRANSKPTAHISSSIHPIGCSNTSVLNYSDIHPRAFFEAMAFLALNARPTKLRCLMHDAAHISSRLRPVGKATGLVLAN